MLENVRSPVPSQMLTNARYNVSGCWPYFCIRNQADRVNKYDMYSKETTWLFNPLTARAFLEILEVSAFFSRACTELKISGLRPIGFSGFLISFSAPLFLLFLSFCCSAAVIDFLLGLPPVQKFLRKYHRDGQFLPWSNFV